MLSGNKKEMLKVSQSENKENKSGSRLDYTIQTCYNVLT